MKKLKLSKLVLYLVILLIAGVALSCSYKKSTREKKSDLEKAIQYYSVGKYNKAMISFVPLAINGCPKAQFYLGNMFYFGRGTDKDYAAAFVYFDLAAKQNLPEALNNLATCYFSGIGVEINFRKGLTYLQIASLEGLPLAILRLGEKYYNGDSVEKNYILAFHCFEKVAQTTNLSQAPYMLAKMYTEGQGVKKNLDKAHEFMCIAAEKGEFGGQIYMGFYYLKHDKPDLAKKWFSIAQKRGDIPEKRIQKFLEFGEVLKQQGEEAAVLYFNEIKKVERLRPIPMMDSLNSDPYLKP